MPSADFADQVADSARLLAEQGVDALGHLFDLTSLRLVRFAATLTRNQHDAEDAVQAAMVRVGLDPPRLASADQPWAYLLRMVHNESLQIARRKKRCTLLTNISDLFTRRTFDQLERADTQRAVWQALRRLPREQSEVVVLKIWEELTFAAIAGILEISANTAASRYQYGMRKLTSQLHSFREVHVDE